LNNIIVIHSNLIKSHLSCAPLDWHVATCEIWRKPHYGSHASDPMSWILNDIINTGYDLFRPIRLFVVNNKRLLHDLFHIGPGISPRLPYQAWQRSWRADMGRGLIPGTIWKISCHNLFITYFTLTFSKHWRGPGWLNELGSWIT
jgi:hypothetical protein